MSGAAREHRLPLLSSHTELRGTEDQASVRDQKIGLSALTEAQQDLLASKSGIIVPVPHDLIPHGLKEQPSPGEDKRYLISTFVSPCRVECDMQTVKR